MTWRIGSAICAVLMSFLITGCGGATDINDLALVMAVGLDQGKTKDSVRVTAQIARPASAVGQTGAPSGGTGEPIWTAIAEGRSIFDAIRNLGQISSRRVYWAHNKVIVMSEKFARHGITDMVDFFSRNHELRMRTWVVVTSKNASEIVSAKTGLQVIPGDSIEKIFRYSTIVAEAPKTDLMLLQADVLSDATEAVVPEVQLKLRGISSKKPEESGNTPQVQLAGAAYFHRDRLEGWLTKEQTRGLLWFITPPKSRIIVLDCPSRHGLATVELTDHKFTIVPRYRSHHVSFFIRLRAGFQLVELGCKDGVSQETVMGELGGRIDQQLKRQVQSVIDKAQQSHTDFLRLGESFRSNYPAAWKKLQPNWNHVFAKARIGIDVKAHVHSPVLLQTQTMPGKTD